MKRLFTPLFVIIITVFANTQSYAMNFGVGAKVGTLGLGLDLTGSLTPYFNARVGINKYDYNYSGSESDVDYDFKLKLSSLPVLLDWHPMQGRFRVSAGMLINSNELEMDAKANKLTYQIGDIAFNLTDVGSLKGKLTFNRMAPYLGIGFGNAVRENTNLNFIFDLGIVFQGSPDLELEANGPITVSTHPLYNSFQTELQKEVALVEDELDSFNSYILIALGLSYQF